MKRREGDEGPITVPSHYLVKFQADIAKFNKKAAKFGLEPLTVVIGKTIMVPGTVHVKSDGREYTREVAFEMVEVTIDGKVPVISDWAFVATISGFTQDYPIISTNPHFKGEIPERFRKTTALCEHCGHVRHRKDVFLLQHKITGEWKQVGRQCLRDFLGNTDIEKVLNYLNKTWEFYGYENDPSDPMFGTEHYEDAQQWLTFAFGAVEKFGWVSGSAARADPTEKTISTRTAIYSRMDRRCKPEDLDWYPVTDDHREMAIAALEWHREKYWDGDSPKFDPAFSDFDRHMAVSIQNGMIHHKALGVATYLAKAYNDHLGREVERKLKRDAEGASRYVGEIGKMLDVQVTLAHYQEFSSDWGVKIMHKFISEDGNVLIWWATSKLIALRGERLSIRGKVHQHQNREGIEQTILKRVRRTDAANGAAA